MQELEEKLAIKHEAFMIGIEEITKYTVLAERYREALEFYAEEDIYEWETYNNPQQQMDFMVIDDGGHKASQALEGE